VGGLGGLFCGGFLFCGLLGVVLGWVWGGWRVGVGEVFFLVGGLGGGWGFAPGPVLPLDASMTHLHPAGHARVGSKRGRNGGGRGSRPQEERRRK